MRTGPLDHRWSGTVDGGLIPVRSKDWRSGIPVQGGPSPLCSGSYSLPKLTLNWCTLDPFVMVKKNIQGTSKLNSHQFDTKQTYVATGLAMNEADKCQFFFLISVCMFSPFFFFVKMPPQACA